MLPVVGLIMGTRLWYQFWDAESDDDSAFERRLDGLVREIGDRGKLISVMPEAVPPGAASMPTHARAPSVAPAPAPVPAAAPPVAAALAPAPGSTQAPAAPRAQTQTPTPPPSLTSASTALAAQITPSIALSSPLPSASLAEQQERRRELSPGDVGSGPHGSFAEMIAFMREEREHMEQKLEKQQAEMERQRQSAEKAMESLRLDAERQRQSAEKAMELLRLDAERQRQSAEKAMLVNRHREVVALQARLEALHAANLLSDDERDAIEDTIADSRDDVTVGDGSDVVSEILALSSKMVADRAFARQLRRRHT